MLLSNLVEEKSNKVIEVLAAAVPLDAIFFGKLIGMLGVSLVGIVIWGMLAAGMLLFNQAAISVPVTPAVGWPLYCLLVLLYFTTNYMVLGALFLGIGGQASNVREVQTLSMPITFAQVMLFALASMVGRRQWRHRDLDRGAVPVQLADGDDGGRGAIEQCVAAFAGAGVATLVGRPDHPRGGGDVPPQRAQVRPAPLAQARRSAHPVDRLRGIGERVHRHPIRPGAVADPRDAERRQPVGRRRGG